VITDRATQDAWVDCQAHIIDPARFPLTAPRGYKPRPDESGTREALAAILDAQGIRHAVLVQLSGYGTDNAPLLDAMAAYPGRFKAIGVVDPAISDRELEVLGAAGMVGVRFNLVSYEPDALMRPDARRLLQRLAALGWFAQVYADDTQWPAAAEVLEASGVQVLVDHFGIRDIRRGVEDPGFQAVLALGREGAAAIKLSSAFRVSLQPAGYDDLDPFVERLLPAFGMDRVVWGSDWPFIHVPRRPTYEDTWEPLARWLPNADDRNRVLSRNPQRLFGFGKTQ
jgi:predicted TIM-barrel fold metal-dependent hydrolase